MPNFSLSRNERLYLCQESTFAQAVAPGNNNYCRHIKATMNNKVALLNRRDKTGTRTVLKGIRGRATAKWTTEMSLVTSGGGANPDCTVLLNMLFGQGPTSKVWSLSDSIITGNLWSYRTPSTLDQRVALGAILQTATFTLGQDIAEWTAEGECAYVLGSNFFSDADTFQLGGLGSFPAEPGSPVSAGDIIAGFTGLIVVDSVTLAEIRTATVKVNTGNALVTDTFGSFYATQAEGDERNISFGFNLYDNDSVGHETLKAAADSKTPVTAVVTVGTIANNIYTFTVNNIQLESPDLDDNQRRFVATYGDSRAHGTNLASKDELALAIS